MAKISGVVLGHRGNREFKRFNVAGTLEVPENIKNGNRDGVEALWKWRRPGVRLRSGSEY
jgi:hypothetical protein